MSFQQKYGLLHTIFIISVQKHVFFCKKTKSGRYEGNEKKQDELFI